MPLVNLHSVIVTFLGHSHLLFGKFHYTHSKSLNFMTADPSIAPVYGLVLENECQ